MILILKRNEMKINWMMLAKLVVIGKFEQMKWKFTSVCTMAGLCDRKIRTVWKTSNTPSYCIRSRTILNEIKTPTIKERTKQYDQDHITLHRIFYSNYTCSTDASWTMHCYRSILAELLFRFMDLSNKIDKSFSRFWHTWYYKVTANKLYYWIISKWNSEHAWMIRSLCYVTLFRPFTINELSNCPGWTVSSICHFKFS